MLHKDDEMTSKNALPDKEYSSQLVDAQGKPKLFGRVKVAEYKAIPAKRPRRKVIPRKRVAGK